MYQTASVRKKGYQFTIYIISNTKVQVEINGYYSYILEDFELLEEAFDFLKSFRYTKKRLKKKKIKKLKKQLGVIP